MAMLRRWPAVLAAVAFAVGMAAVAAQAPATAPTTAHRPAHAPPPASAPAQVPAAGAPAATLSSECVTPVFNMSDCLPYVTSGSKDRHPDKACCPELDSLLESSPVCLCQLLAGGADSYGVSVDIKRAMALPGICGLTAPPVSACALLGVPVPGAPTSAPLTGAPSPSATSAISPSATGPQMPENPPSSSPSKSHASGRATAGGLLAAIAAVAAAGMF